ncbi:hypothetical protein [Calothrix sp. NIES-3974]|uniref:hypothetical protein n=1 Tax=Calothrix sp. NIES-3974 TaxID=2005462 RepID=UPI000B5F7A4D|nr:hypothetical protein [Calothrix sp. NIES-3974]BAZ03497.1 hypothetical protein NIES3974_01230 [Calothrix sp. NIES-3974]
MNNQIGLITKVMLASAVISVGIKYALPYVPIPATDANALAIVLFPTLVTMGVLGYRFIRSETKIRNS